MKNKKGLTIALIGATGTGKTTLGKIVKKRLDGAFFEEQWKNNPYIVGEKAKSATPLEIALSFLLMRYKQQSDAEKLRAAGRIVIMDTFLQMSDIYSRHFLDKIDYKSFKEIYQKFSEDVVEPDMVVYLSAPPTVLLERITNRNYGVDLEKSQTTIESIVATDRIIKAALSKLKNVIKINTDKKSPEEIAQAIIDEIGKVK